MNRVYAPSGSFLAINFNRVLSKRRKGQGFFWTFVRVLVCIAPMLAVQVASATETVTYYYSDNQGTVLATANASGALTATGDSRPYGTQTLGSPSNGPGYTGHIGDVDSGLVYMQARYYDPAVGRFLSVDPVGPKAGDGFVFDRYDYANNNPMRYTDPDGRKCSTVDGKDSCTFDEVKDKNGKTIPREQALSSGSKFSKFFHADMGSRIRSAEAAMTAKYS